MNAENLVGIVADEQSRKILDVLIRNLGLGSVVLEAIVPGGGCWLVCQVVIGTRLAGEGKAEGSRKGHAQHSAFLEVVDVQSPVKVWKHGKGCH